MPEPGISLTDRATVRTDIERRLAAAGCEIRDRHMGEVIDDLTLALDRRYDLLVEPGRLILARVYHTRPSPPEVNSLPEHLGRWSRAGTGTATRNVRVALLLTDSADAYRDLLRRIGAHHFCTIIPIAVPELLAADGNPSAVVLQSLEKWLTRVDRFDEKDPVVHTFFGREAEIADVAASIECGRQVGVFGLRKIGKSSLLGQLARGLPRNLVVNANLQAVTPVGESPAPLWRHLVERVGEACAERQLTGWESSARPGDTPDERLPGLFRETVQRVLGALATAPDRFDSRIVLAVDEIDLFLSGHVRGGAEFFDWCRTGRGPAADPGVVVVVAGVNARVTEDSRLEGRDNPAFELFRVRYLSGLAGRDNDAMLREIGHAMAVSFDGAAPARIHQASGGHPYLARQLASFVWDREGKGRLITAEMVDRHLDRFVRDRGKFLQEIWDSLKDRFPEELNLLRRVSADQVCDVRDLDPAFDCALTHLLGYGLVEEVDDLLGVRIDLLNRWLARRRGGT